MPRTNKELLNCLNCNSPFNEADLFCSNCSQKRTNGLISVKDLFSDFFSTVFNIDGKLVNTIKDLFIPGELTKSFFAGHQEKYYKPLRLFFFFMVTHLAILSLTVLNSNSTKTNPLDKAFFKIQNKKESRLILDTLLMEQRNNFKSSKSTEILDSISANIERSQFENLDSINIDDIISEIDQSIKIGFNADFKIAVNDIDLMRSDYDKFCEKYEISDFGSKLGLQQTLKLFFDPKGSMNYIIGNITWMLILLIPVIALILKGLYFRQNFYYVQHLVFLFHIHSFAFLILSLVATLSHLINKTSIGVALLLLASFGLVTYFFKSIKNFYGQSSLKTLLKYLMILVSYFFIGFTFLIITIMVSFALYA